MIEALIAAALAGAVTTLVRRDRRSSSSNSSNVDQKAHHTMPTIDVDAVDTPRSKMHKGIEHRIRSLADIRLRKYLNEGRISEEEYRALTDVNAVYSKDDYSTHTYHGSAGIDAIRAESRDKRSNGMMVMQEILFKLDALHSRLDTLEGKMSMDIMTPASLYANSTPLAQVQDQEQSMHTKRHKSRGSSRKAGPRGGDEDGRVRKGGVNEGKRRQSEKVGVKDEDDVELIIVDDVNSNPRHLQSKGVMGSEYIDDHLSRYVDYTSNNGSSSNVITESSSATTIVNNHAAGYDSDKDEELESIKRQIMDALARLEKGE